MHLGQIEALDDAPSVHVVSFYGGNGDFDPGWYLINRLYEQHGLPFAGPFSSSDAATSAWAAHRQNMRTTKAPSQGLLFAGNNSIVFEPTVIINPYAVSLGSYARIDSFVKIEGGQGCVIGERVHIASYAHIGIGGGVTILEEGSSVGSGGRVMSGSNMPDAVSCSAVALAENQRQEKHVTRICKNATVYAGATIMPGVTVGEGARVGAGAVVTKDVPAFEIWVGMPAKKLRGLR
jgi:acetyltransferase-like isoleucine patch superfamily enzyme